MREQRPRVVPEGAAIIGDHGWGLPGRKADRLSVKRPLAGGKMQRRGDGGRVLLAVQSIEPGVQAFGRGEEIGILADESRIDRAKSSFAGATKTSVTAAFSPPGWQIFARASPAATGRSWLASAS